MFLVGGSQEFQDAREEFLGTGNYNNRQDIVRGLDRLRRCTEPEAIYVCSLHGDRAPKTVDEARTVFSEESQHPVDLCYLALLEPGIAWSGLKQSADFGHPYACAIMSATSHDQKNEIAYAQRAATTGDRRGMYQLAACDADASENDLLFRSASLGYAHAMYNYAFTRYGRSDLNRYMWLEKALVHGNDVTVTDVTAVIASVLTFKTNATIQFACGRIIKRQGKKMKWTTKEEKDRAKVAVSIYTATYNRARAATLTWLMCAPRLGIYKDVARLIGRLLIEATISFL